jgi:4-amino-4-deoxy-L-arabinose transferase-like glycosyltransferase
MVHHAPLFPVMLAGMGLLSIDPMDGARWLNCVLFSSNILLSAHLIKRETASPLSAMIGATLLLISLPMLEIHSMAWSEPAFVFFSLLALFRLSQYARRAGDGDLISAAVATGLAILSRYAGLVLVGAGRHHGRPALVPAYRARLRRVCGGQWFNQRRIVC